MARSLMIQGTTSGAGKSTVTALICRYLSKKGMKVAPFKSMNLSLNSYVTRSGEEIGISQAFQAWASGIEPEWVMNPILLKSRSKGSIQVILRGRPYIDTDMHHSNELRQVMLDAVNEAYSDISKRYDFVIIEGSGSPAEINLRRKDIANMTTARLTKSPVILVGDIEYGGVFAGIYGTYELIEEEDRKMLKAFVINRFRGDMSILMPGIEKIKEMTNMSCPGILPYADLRLPEEDALDLGKCQGKLEGKDVRKAWLENLDEFLETSIDSFNMAEIENIISSGL